jgi:hypothetical protein
MWSALVLRIFLVVLCVASAWEIEEVRGATVTTDPALPLVDVPFCATPSSGIRGSSLFVSSTSDCSTVLATAGDGCAVGGAAAFNVTSASLSVDLSAPVMSVPITYWCHKQNDGPATVTGTLQMNVVKTVPMYYPTKQLVTMTFNEATPVGSTILFVYADGTCIAPILNYGQFTLSDNRSVQVFVSVESVGVCAILTSPVSGASNGLLLLRNTLFGGPALTITPDVGVRNTTVNISTGNNYIFYFGLSKSPTCSDMSASGEPQVTTTLTLSLEVTKPAGDYYFCVAEGRRLYYAAVNMFHVIAYGVQPAIAYAQWSTRIFPSINATSRMQVALFTKNDCSGAAAIGWSGFTDASWNVPLAGTYYACVRPSATSLDVYYADPYVVVPTPSLTANQYVAVRKFGLAVTLTAPSAVTSSAQYSVALSSDMGCTKFYRRITTTSGISVSFVIGADAASTLYYCVSNPLLDVTADNDGASVASYAFVGSIAVRDFQLSYDALHAKSAATITLDSVVALPKGLAVAFVPASQFTCADVSGAAKTAAATSSVTTSNTLAGVTFPKAGTWLMCAQLNSSGSMYTNLQSVSVYGDATVDPLGFIPRITTTFTVTGLQPRQPAFLTADPYCSTATSSLSSNLADNSGTALLTLTYNYTGTLRLCGAFTGVKDGTATTAVEKREVGSVTSANPHVYPSVMELSVGQQALRVVGNNAVALVNKSVLLAHIDSACPASMTMPIFAIVLPPLQLSSGAVSPSTTLTLNDNMMDTRFRACVETNDTYIDAGTVAVTRVSFTPTITTSNAGSLVAGQLALLSFPESYFVVALLDSYVVVAASASCTNDLARTTVYASGGIDPSTGAADAFLAPTPASGTTMNLRVCVAKRSELLNSTYGYVDGGAFTSNLFTVVNKYATTDLDGGVTGWPMLSYASLYLVRCSGSGCRANSSSATCRSSSPQYAVNGTSSAPTASKPSTGTYLLCQRVAIGSTTKVVGSNTTIEVINAYSMSSTANLDQLQPFVDFDAVVAGGDGQTVEVVVQSASVPCGVAATSSQSFTFTTNVQRTLAITALTRYGKIQFCAKPNSHYRDAFRVMTATLRSYVSPTYISFLSLGSSSVVTVTPRTTTSLQAMLARGPDCSASIDGGAPTAAVGGTFPFVVPPCGANSDLSVVHFCDMPSGIATYRGPILLLRNGNCTANDGTASISAVSVAPGTPITDFGVDTKYLTVTGMSKTSDCSSKIPATSAATVGYAPSVGETAAFYVCTYISSSPNVTFTTRLPTLTVRNYAATPKITRSPLSIVNSGAERVSLAFNSPLPSGYVFFSSETNCLTNIGDAPGLNTSAASTVYSHTNLCGTVSVCWQDSSGGTPMAVAQFTSVTTPALQSSTLAVVRGAYYSATFARDSCSSSISSSGEMQVYLSADQCASPLGGTAVGTDATSFMTSIASSLLTGLSTVSLCASTAAGMMTVIAGVPVARDKVYPVSFTTGTTQARIFMPSFASTSFWLSTTDAACNASSAATTTLPTFSTDASGYGKVNMVSANGLPVSVGSYSLCYSSSGSAVALETISVVVPTFFDVRGTSFVTGVSSKMLMQDDLQASDLLEGFSTASDCSALSTTYGTWTRVSSTSIKVTAKRASATGAYLCARVPLNLTVAALPNAWSNTARSITFARPTLAVPSTGLDACTDYTLTQCVPPNGGGNDATNRLTVVHGDCCNSSDEANAIGVGSMAGGTCSLRFDEARARSYPASTIFSLCAWNSFDASVCATLNYVTVSTNCQRLRVKESTGFRGGAVTGIALGAVFGGLALITAIGFVTWCCRRQRAGRGKVAGKDGDDDDSSAVSFYAGDGVVSTVWDDTLNAPPLGNNCGRSSRLSVSTSAAEMRRDVLIQLADGSDEVASLDSWREPLDTNFMDDCEELTEKYKNFLNRVSCNNADDNDADRESVSDFPAAAFLRRSQLDTEKLIALAKLHSRTSSAAVPDCAEGEAGQLQRHELLYEMQRTNPAAKTMYLFFEEENYARNAVAISEETAFFNLRVLSKSYKAMVSAQHDYSTTPHPPPHHRTGEANSGATYRLSQLSFETNGRTVLSDPLTPAQLQERRWLHRHRGELEFPWVTNNFRTLVGYRKNDGEQYNYVDWSFTLLDLQAFHPLHRWWSPLLPRVTAPSAADAQDPRFAFMHPKSTVPFVKRYFMLFKAECTARAQIEVQAVTDVLLIQKKFLEYAGKLDLLPAQAKTMSWEDATVDFARSTATDEATNPLQRNGAGDRQGLKGIRDLLSRIDIAAGVGTITITPSIGEESSVFGFHSDTTSVFNASS